MNFDRIRSKALTIMGLIALSLAVLGSDDCDVKTTRSYPIRIQEQELTEFRLCELDRKTLAPLSECIPAKVPGDIFTALMEAGRIPDPYIDTNSQDLAWVDERAWRYEADFDLEPSTAGRDRLLFMGIDYISKVELNGKVLHEQEGMFSRIDLDVTGVLDPSGKQKLAVTIFGVPGTSMEWMGPVLGSNEFGRRNFLKTQMSFGWDFAPRLKGGGIWDRVYLYESGPVTVSDVFARGGMNGAATVEVTLQGKAPADCTLKIAVDGVDFEMEAIEQSVDLQAGRGDETIKFEVQVDNPRLWRPWDMGGQDLYSVVASVEGEGWKNLAGETFGFREIKWGPNPDAPKGSADWVLFVNGQREFIRGANWVPPEAMYGRMDDTRYEKLIGLAKQAGVNCLRIWGGGNRERRAFYDACDRAGIMVWQEFPFACVYLVGYPRDKRFKELVRHESFEIVRQLRNHASLIMWCGGNEFNAVQNKHVVKILEQAAAQDPTRRFIPASPYQGDSHNWVVWHMKGNLDDYFDDISPLPSEFGLQAFPALTTLQKWISPEYLWPLNDVLVHHDLGQAKMDKYVSVIGPEDNLESYIRASQLMQAHYLQRGIEHWRQRKYATSGTAFWQLNEPWPSICWSVIDYELQPKLAYRALQNTYNPLLVSAVFDDRAWKAGDELTFEIVVVNDLHREFPGAEIQARVCGEDAGSWTADVGEDSVVKAAQVSVKIPATCERPVLDLTLNSGDGVSINHYELWIHDDKPAGPVNRGLEKIGKRIMSGAKQSQWKD